MCGCILNRSVFLGATVCRPIQPHRCLRSTCSWLPHRTRQQRMPIPIRSNRHQASVFFLNMLLLFKAQYSVVLVRSSMLSCFFVGICVLVRERRYWDYAHIYVRFIDACSISGSRNCIFQNRVRTKINRPWLSMCWYVPLVSLNCFVVQIPQQHQNNRIINESH